MQSSGQNAQSNWWFKNYRSYAGSDFSDNSNFQTNFRWADAKGNIFHATVQDVLDFLNGVDNNSSNGETADVVDPDDDNADQEGPGPKPLTHAQELAKYGQIDVS